MIEGLTASVVLYGTDPAELRKCLECLAQGGAAAIYAVDNSPTRALEAVAGEFQRVRYIFTGRNLGYGAAHNLAMRRALDQDHCEFHLVINSDVYFAPEILGRIVGFMRAAPDVGQLQPRLVYPDGRLQYTVRMLPTPADVFVRRFMPSWVMRRARRRYLLADWDHASPLDVPYHQGSFMMLRAAALRECGLFDERYFMYPEDIDLTRRIHLRWRTLYWPGAEAVHAHRAASYHSWRMTWVHARNMCRYFNKWGWVRDAGRRRLNRALLARLRALS